MEGLSKTTFVASVVLIVATFASRISIEECPSENRPADNGVNTLKDRIGRKGGGLIKNPFMFEFIGW